MRSKLRAVCTAAKARLKNDQAQIRIIGPIIGIVGTILTAIVAVQVLGDLGQPFMDSLADFVGVYTGENTTTNSTTADELLPTLGLIAAIIGPLALLGLGIASLQFRER